MDLSTLEISKDSFIEADLADYYAQQAISKDTGEYIMTPAEKLRNEGKLEGLVEGERRGEKRGQKMGRLESIREAIELGISLKFPEDINAVMVKVNAIDDLEILGKIKR